MGAILANRNQRLLVMMVHSVTAADHTARPLPGDTVARYRQRADFSSCLCLAAPLSLCFIVLDHNRFGNQERPACIIGVAK